jgi:aminopeptidase YwaD
MKRYLSLFLISFFTSGLLFGQQTVFDFSRQSITNRLKANINVLASDSFMGRESGTKGEILARDYIVSEFREAGITPFFGDTSYIQPFKITQNLSRGTKNNFKVNNTIYLLDTDFFPVAYSGSDSVSAQMVYLNYGISAPSLNYDNYNGKKDLKGKIFVIELSIPGEYKMKSDLRAYSLMSYKIELALKNGASGIIFINSDHKYPYEPVMMLAGYKNYKIPVIYFKKSVDVLFSKISETPTAFISTDIKSDKSGVAFNVAGFINNNAAMTVVIGGHYDHLGLGGENSLSPGSQLIHNGADDNASGTAGVIELARYLKNSGLKKYNYILVAFSGEEEGLLGSEYFVKTPEFKKYMINYMLNLDMIGRLDSSLIVELWAAGSSPEWKKIIKNDPPTSFIIKYIKGSLRDSDHYPFYKNRIPTMFFITGLEPDYHTPRDKAYKINFTGETEIVVYLEKLITQLDSKGKIKFKKVGIIANSRATIYMLNEMIQSMSAHK